MTEPLRPISIAARENPFDGRLHSFQLEGEIRNPTIADLLAMFEDLPDGFEAYCEARINGEQVLREHWSRVRPISHESADTAVTFTVPLRGPGGGATGGGHKNVLATVATIAVLLVAAAVSGGTLLPAALGLTAGTVSAIGGAAIGIGGALATNALGQAV
jgi:hypothetical protein